MRSGINVTKSKYSYKTFILGLSFGFSRNGPIVICAICLLNNCTDKSDRILLIRYQRSLLFFYFFTMSIFWTNIILTKSFHKNILYIVYVRIVRDYYILYWWNSHAFFKLSVKEFSSETYIKYYCSWRNCKKIGKTCFCFILTFVLTICLSRVQTENDSMFTIQNTCVLTSFYVFKDAFKIRRKAATVRVSRHTCILK